jgi:hypothetical protein
MPEILGTEDRLETMTQREHHQEKQHFAARKIAKFFQSIVRRAQGTEYSCIFGEGPLGLSMEEIVVTGCEPGGQAEANGVTVGSRVWKINHMYIDSLLDLTLFLMPAKRPVEITFLKQHYIPRTRSGELLKVGTLGLVPPGPPCRAAHPTARAGCRVAAVFLLPNSRAHAHQYRAAVAASTRACVLLSPVHRTPLHGRGVAEPLVAVCTIAHRSAPFFPCVWTRHRDAQPPPHATAPLSQLRRGTPKSGQTGWKKKRLVVADTLSLVLAAFSVKVG